ncbi:OsmC [uncultured Woeseiaceae bacterium]|uniref:OsmC n=1 Tax=uncultured Woeseiaceae bacterium TaxID=1983305 RepID=A0A7D9D3C3_9GAMM|nr:OsmC [uncultured Woeseiaceae bacterium]
MSVKSTGDCIESANAPLAYKAEGIVTLKTQQLEPPLHGVRVATRALAGMQKEALVTQSFDETVWRMVCDEGPYLNGTDLAPPPLAYFSAGMASSIAAGVLALARERGTELSDLEIVLDNRYSMEGSAIRGTMIAGALPVDLSVSAHVAGKNPNLNSLVFAELSKSPVDALMRNSLVDTFSIVRNSQPIPTGAVEESANPTPDDPVGLFSKHRYVEHRQALTDAVLKLETTESVFDADHGAGAAMKNIQKRQLHIRSILAVRDDGLREVKVQIFKPIGSVFRFLSDDSSVFGGLGRAPSGLAYVSAGIAFCFMTQLGRYAHIVKKNLDSYGVIQDTTFDVGEGRTLPVDTHTYIETTEDQETTQKYVDMGEQTCFLHGACRLSNKSRIKIAGR